MYTYSLQKHELKFKVPAKTSRNTFTTRTIFLITLNDIQTGKQGIGEASPLSLLSLDDVPNYQLILEKKLDEFLKYRDKLDNPVLLSSIKPMDLVPKSRFNTRRLNQ